MSTIFTLLLGWLPGSLYIIALGVIVIFSIMVVLRLVALILDVIPFL